MLVLLCILYIDIFLKLAFGSGIIFSSLNSLNTVLLTKVIYN